MKTYRNELLLLLLSFITYHIWFNIDYDFRYGLLIYILIFLFLIIRKMPLSYFMVVILFSIMAIQTDSGIYKVDYILTTILFGYVIIKNIIHRYIVLGSLFFILIINLLYNLLSVTWAPVLGDAFEGIVGMVQGYMFYYIVTNSKLTLNKNKFIEISKIASFLMLTLSAQILTIYVQHGFDNVIARKNFVELGWGFSNLIAIVYTFLIPIALYKYTLKKGFYLHYYLIDLIGIIALFLTLSRGAIIGVLASLVLFLLLFLRTHFLLKYGSITTICALIIYKHETLLTYFTKIKNQFIGNDFLNDSGRFPLYQLALDHFLEKPWFGQGVKASKYLISEAGRGSIHYHNFILQILATLGIVGFIFFIIIMLKTLRLMVHKEPFILCCFLGLIASLIHQLVDVSYDLFFFGIYMYGVIALVEWSHQALKTGKKMRIIEKKNA